MPALILPALLVLLLTGLSRVSSDAWWIRVWDFPRPQLAAAALILLALAALLLNDARGWQLTILAITLLTIGLNIVPIRRYTALEQVTVPTAPERDAGLVVMTANVLMSNRDVDALMALVRDRRPDVLLLVEVDAWWCEHMAAALEGYEWRQEVPLENTYGMALYSRLPLKDTVVRYLVEDGEVPSIWTVVEVEGGPVRLVCIHPRPPRADKLQDTTTRDFELVLVANIVKDEDRPTIVAGDLNDVAWSATSRLFQRTSGLLDPRVGRGLYNSFHAQYPFLRFPLDHIFVSKHFQLQRMERLPAFGSDHFPILGKFLLLPSEQAILPEDPDTADIKEEEAIVERAEDSPDVTV